VVLDFYAGTGTTGVVALRLGRSFVGVELSPRYAAAARKRLAQVSPPLDATWVDRG
jgi:modification methylase